MRGSFRRGAALVEVLIGLVILGTAGTALLTALGQTRHTMRNVRATERQLDSASAELDRLVLLDRDELRQRQGWTIRGSWSIRVTLSSTVLFDVAVARTPESRPLLETTLYRPDSANVP